MGRFDDDRLGITIRSTDGFVKRRLGPDELEDRDLADAIEFGTTDPGGYKDSGFSLPRADLSGDDLALFNEAAIWGLGGGLTGFEGRIQETPSSVGDEISVDVNSVGWAAHLEDDPSFREVYVDRDLNSWQTCSRARKISLVSALYNPQDHSVDVDPATGLPSLLFYFEGAWTTYRPFVEPFYDAGPGCRVKAIYYDFAPGPTVANTFTLSIGVSDRDDFATTYEKTGNLNSVTGAGGAALYQPTLPRRYGFWQFFYNGGAAGADGFPWPMNVRRAAVFGDSGVPIVGAAPDQGVYGDAVIANIVQRTAPLLKFTTGYQDSSIVPASSFVIPHLAFRDPLTGSDAILATNAFFGRSWGVEEGRSFFWRPLDRYRKRWRVRRSNGTADDLDGPQAEDAVNGVIVQFTDPSGLSVSVGPPAATSVDSTSALLADTNTENAVNAAGLPRKWAIISLDFVSTPLGATACGYAWLQERLNSPSVRGTITCSRLVEDEAGVLYPAWFVRAGDSIEVMDGDRVEHRIIETKYSHKDRRLVATIDSTPHRVDALFERMGVVLQGYV